MTVATVAATNMPSEKAKAPPVVAFVMAACGILIPVISLTKFVALAAYPSLHHMPWVLVSIDPYPILLANCAAHSPLWLFLLAGGLRSIFPMIPYYCMGVYGPRYAKSKAERHNTMRIVRTLRAWTAKIKKLKKRSTAFIKCKLSPVTSRIKLKRKNRSEDAPRRHWVMVLMIFLRPNGWMALIAGLNGLNPVITFGAGIAGTAAWLLAIGFAGEYVPHIFLAACSIF